MKRYLQELTQKLSQFSKKLDDTTLFIGKPWVLIDPELKYHKYIFKNDGKLIMSLNGQVQIGTWEYITGTNSILIDRIKDKILLTQSFFDEAVMVLKFDGLNSDFFVLANETIIPDLDVKKYLKSLTHQKFNILELKLENGKTLEIHRNNTIQKPVFGMLTTIDGENPKDGNYKIQNNNARIELKQGKVFKITFPFGYICNNGTKIIIEQLCNSEISIGDFVYIDNELAKTGHYKLSFMNILEVVNGVIIKKKYFN